MKIKDRMCRCFIPLNRKDATKQLVDEIIELIKKPALDELSDCLFGLGRLIASLFGRLYFHIPFDKRHWDKITLRMNNYNCIRSKRYLIDNKCPSTVLKN